MKHWERESGYLNDADALYFNFSWIFRDFNLVFIFFVTNKIKLTELGDKLKQNITEIDRVPESKRET